MPDWNVSNICDGHGLIAVQAYMEKISPVISSPEERTEMLKDISLFSGWYLLVM